MTTTAYMLIVLPNVGASTDTWGTELNTALQAIIDPHDHTTGKGKQVPTAGIGINADLDMSAWRLTTVGGVDFDNLGATLTTGACEAFVAFGDLYYRNNTGTNIRITNGGALNMTTVGGIAGDYTSAGAEVAFVDAQDGYTFKQQTGAAVRQYAKMDCADVRLYEFKAHPAAAPPTNFVSLKSPAALAASYQVTMPAAVPASTLPVQMSAAGVLSVGGSIAMASGDHVTVSGTGRFKHGDLVKSHPAIAYVIDSNFTRTALGYIVSTGIGAVYLPIFLDEGERIKSVTFAVYGDGSADLSYDFFTVTAAGVQTSIGPAGTVTNPPASWNDTTVDVTDTTVTSGLSIYGAFTSNAANIRLGNIRVTYDRP